MPKPKSFVMPAVPPDDKAVACRHVCSVGILAGWPSTDCQKAKTQSIYMPNLNNLIIT